jgi:hypothetical protein
VNIQQGAGRAPWRGFVSVTRSCQRLLSRAVRRLKPCFPGDGCPGNEEWIGGYVMLEGNPRIRCAGNPMAPSRGARTDAHNEPRGDR